MTQATFTVPSTGIYTHRTTGGRYRYTSGQVIPLDWAIELQMPGAAFPAEPSPFNQAEEAQIESLATSLATSIATDLVTTSKEDEQVEARTATAAGTTTGQVTKGTNFVVVTCDDANKIITLPALDVGEEISLANGATGYELRTSSPTTIAINGGTGANAESAIGANTLVECKAKDDTHYLCEAVATDGARTAVEAAAT